MTGRSAPPRRAVPTPLLALPLAGRIGQPDVPRTEAPPVTASVPGAGSNRARSGPSRERASGQLSPA